jgi:hypothetical protein
MTDIYEYTDPTDNKYFSKALSHGIVRNKRELDVTITKRIKIIFWSSLVGTLVSGSGLYQVASYGNTVALTKTIQAIEQSSPSKRSLAIAKKKAQVMSDRLVSKSLLDSLPTTLAISLLSTSGLWFFFLKPSYGQQRRIQDILNQLIEDYKTIEFCDIPLDDLAAKFSQLEGRQFTREDVVTVLNDAKQTQMLN